MTQPASLSAMAIAGSWEKLQGVVLDKHIVSVLADDLGFPTMTPVQAAAIPPLLSSRDVCADAETGSGKTLSYLVPIAQGILYGRDTQRAPKPSQHVRALVILPTRELARQVLKVARTLFNVLPGDVSPCAMIGGGSAAAAAPTDRDARVVIATPGRLNAALVSGELHMSSLEFLILDEADRLLDMGFSVTLTSIFARLPKQRRTGLYSATQSSGVDELARAGLRNPVRVAVKVRSAVVDVDPVRTPASLRCYYAVVAQNDKLPALLVLLRGRHKDKMIVYFLTCASVDYHAMLPLLKLADRPVYALHGKMMQHRRNRNLKLFAASDNGVLLCTDVASRGIDLPDVDAVIQFDIPQDPDVYVHRVGRTARLGRSGYSLILITPEEDAYIDFLRIRKCPAAHVADARDLLGDDVVNGLASQSDAGEELMEERKTIDKVTRECALADRAVLEASEKAFLSYIRGYKEHKCRYILKLENFNVGALARAFHLLRMPKFHEFKKLKGKLVFEKDETVFVRDIKFKNKDQEEKRQRQIREATEAPRNRKTGKAGGKINKRKREKGSSKNSKGKKGNRKDDAEKEDEDFGYAAGQLRKMKRGKITEEEFVELMEKDDD